MNKKLWSLFLILLALPGCQEHPCDGLDNGVYKYPVEKAKGKSLEESIEIYKIPDVVLQCISTDGLVKSCITYPEMRMIWTREPLQQGFDYIEGICNGFDELWIRQDKFEALFNIYSRLNIDRDWENFTDVENGRFIFNIIYHEIILAQDEILLNLTSTQKLELFQLAFDNQVSKIELKKYYGTVGMETSLAILSRIMYNDQYQPFLEEYDSNEILQIHVGYIKILSKDLVDKIMTMADEYLENLKK
ncbi:MAG: hypothetical protein ACP5D9_11480 [Mariniphaga sp.]